MKAIYKYPLPIKEKYELELPKDAIILRVEDVDGLFWLWAIVDNEVSLEKRFFECYKTGQPIETPLDDLRYVGACKMFIMQELYLYTFENILKTGQNRVLCIDMENPQSN